MKKLLLLTVTLGSVVALPTVATAGRCPATVSLEAQQEAAIAEANAIADKCSPAWLAAENRILAMGRNIRSTGLAAGCKVLHAGIPVTLAMIQRRNEQCAAVAAQKKNQQIAVNKPPVQSAPRDSRNIPTPQTQHRTPQAQPAPTLQREAHNTPTPQTKPQTPPAPKVEPPQITATQGPGIVTTPPS